VWGRGLGLEAWMAIIKYLFEEKEMKKITAGTLTKNTAMLKIMKKSKMLEDGVRKNHCLFEGKRVDMVHAALFKE
jgi:RimJ/RimL family protein N-acetyltransferase